MKAGLFQRVLKLRHELGPLGMAGLALLIGAGLFLVLVQQPLQDKRDRLASALERQAGRAAGQNGSAGEKLAALSRLLEPKEGTTDALAKLYAIGQATGVVLQSGSYRESRAGSVERYEIKLPVAGSYGQIRDFLKRALTEIPTLSLDQISLKRENRNEGAVHAGLQLTLHRAAR